MIVREATREDVAQIIGLLRISLGEELIPKSEAYWHWKHESNPFGKSPVLVIEDNGKLVGVRAFMLWKWRWKELHFSALRAVDTATHPDTQGKGIFRKLTLQLADACRAAGHSFIFNTPNNVSRPGYLSMGWSLVGRHPVRVSPTFRMLLAITGIRKSSWNPDTLTEYLVGPLELYRKPLEELVRAQALETRDRLTTDLSVDYLKWRYADVPVTRYYWLNDFDQDATYCVFFRPKVTPYGLEARIVDVVADPDRVARRRLLDQLSLLRRKFDFLSVAGAPPSINRLLYRCGFSPSLSVGPRVTARNLNLENSTFLLNFGQWKPTLGDLELF